MSALSDNVRILVVDDERVISDTLATILRARGYRTRVAYCADEAIALASEFRPHALIADVVMPGMDGRQLAGYFGEHHPECKVMLISDGLAAGPQLLKSAQRILDFLASCTLEEPGADEG